MVPVFILCGKSPQEGLGGGYSSFAYNLATVLSKLNLQIFIVVLAGQNKLIKTKFGQIIKIKSPLNPKISVLPLLPYYSILLSLTVGKIIKKNNFPRVIIWGIGPWGLGGVILKIIYKKKVTLLNNYFTTIKHEWKGSIKAVTVSDYGLILKLKYLLIYATLVQILSFFEGLLLKFVDKIITNYQSTEEILQKEFRVPNSKFFKTHFWVKPLNRKPGGKLPSLPPKFILSLSRQDPRKGVNYLIHAINILRSQNIKLPLLIAGTGEMLSANQKLVRKLKLEKQIKFLGFVQNCAKIMKKCTLFCLPSVEEGAGALSLNEAMSLGIPIVTTAIDGIIEDIKDQKEGLLVPPFNSRALADALAKLLQNPKVAKSLGRNAKRKFDHQFNQTLMEKDLKNLLFGLLQNPKEKRDKRFKDS